MTFHRTFMETVILLDPSVPLGSAQAAVSVLTGELCFERGRRISLSPRLCREVSEHPRAGCQPALSLRLQSRCSTVRGVTCSPAAHCDSVCPTNLSTCRKQEEHAAAGTERQEPEQSANANKHPNAQRHRGVNTHAGDNAVRHTDARCISSWFYTAEDTQRHGTFELQ